jgi:hypothetical protein
MPRRSMTSGTAYVMAMDWYEAHPEDAYGDAAVELAEDQLRWFIEDKALPQPLPEEP